MRTQGHETEKELKTLLRTLRFRSLISGLLRRAASERELAQQACLIAVEDVGYRMAWIGMVEKDPEKTLSPFVHAGAEEGYLSVVRISWGDSDLGRGPVGRAIRGRTAVFTCDVSTDPKMVPWREECLKRGYHSTISLPLIVEDEVIGAIALYGAKPDDFPADEVELLEEVAKDLAYGITALRVREQRANAERELRQAKEEAESANRMKSQFLDIAAHELRTPITALSLLVQSSRVRLRERGQAVELATLDRMHGGVTRLAGLVEDLLNTASLERGMMVLRPLETDLTALVSQCLDIFKSQNPGREFSFISSDSPLEAKIDPVRIEQVVANLLDNAVKYSPKEQSIEVRIEHPGNRVRVSVTDHGRGISRERQSGLFSRFFRISSNETIRNPGLGLGLFICRSIIELHGGTIEVRSEAAQGCTFFFELPLQSTA